jgi:N-acetyl sugar amidotransferase
MDTSDPDIVFDAQGICHHCHAYDEAVRTRVTTAEPAKLEALVTEIKQAGQGLPYDCIIGISGGVDSTYVAFATRKLLGLRPLAVHLDNGWDSELAVQNIQHVLEKLDIELYTEVLDWDEFRDLQLAFLRASTPDSEIPSDHAIVSVLYQQAKRHGVRYILSGCNVRTESHLPPAWSRGHSDWRYIQSLQKRFGTRKLKTFPHRNMVDLVWNARTTNWIDILNFLDYKKAEALRVLQDELGWQYYGGKHYESIYTRFYQGYILPRKFGFDKRRMHLSSLVCSGEMTRSEALAELEKPTYSEVTQAEDREYVAKKLGISDAELEKIMRSPTRRFEDYPSYETSLVVKIARKVRAMLPFR